MNNNELKKAAKVLRRYQDWRTGRDIRTLDEANLLPADLTGAIDTILQHLGLPEPLIDCSKCHFNGENQGFGGCIKAGAFNDKQCICEVNDEN